MRTSIASDPMTSAARRRRLCGDSSFGMSPSCSTAVAIGEPYETLVPGGGANLRTLRLRGSYVPPSPHGGREDRATGLTLVGCGDAGGAAGGGGDGERDS